MTLLIYAIAVGDRSSRLMEQRCVTDVAYRFIMANQKPGHSTLCRFRKTHEQSLGKVFLKVLRLCKRSGMIKVGVVALDGTKLVASAALSANRKKDALAVEIQSMFSEVDTTDNREDTN